MLRHGKRAFLGRRVSVRYIGKLKKNGIIFDSAIGQAPFEFRLVAGVGEVIRGWDVGVEDMRIGGKRRITIPPAMAKGLSAKPATTGQQVTGHVWESTMVIDSARDCHNWLGWEVIREVPDGDVYPLRVLQKAHAVTQATGSSTACIVALKNQDLHAIKYWNSGFIVIRDGCLLFESPVQQHGFNDTYQLAGGNEGDLPGSGHVFKIPTVPGDIIVGDIIVAGSDGLFDNLYNTEITTIAVDDTCLRD
ncbi:hypothetical protein CASFOL_029260 [Castilleja foliolosa]|uniref:Protein phosphatase n=1 Tax=Castilleja foliolosa TaxID=1961234 RepID=A0ABD3CAI6_9LAMI